MQSVKNEQSTEQSEVPSEAQDPVTLSDQELAFVGGAGIGIHGTG